MRTASLRDAYSVRWLDDVSFPPDSLDGQRAEPGELEAGIEAGDVRVLEWDGRIVGYLHADTSPRRIYVSGLAIHPDEQARGLGTRLIEACLADLSHSDRATRPIISVTSPNNHSMLHLLFTHGFVARWALRDFFGPGRHRFGLQLRARRLEGDRKPSRLVPAAQVDDTFALLDMLQDVVGGMVRVAGQPHFEVQPYLQHEYPEDSPAGFSGVSALVSENRE